MHRDLIYVFIRIDYHMKGGGNGRLGGNVHMNDRVEEQRQ